MNAKLLLVVQPRNIISKIERAEKHIRDLQLASQAFFDSRPYEIIAEKNSDTAERTYYLGDIAEVPAEIIAICGDALHNLRSALDYLAFQIIRTRTKPSERSAFPIAKSSTIYMSSKARREIEVARPDAIKYIDTLEPYKGGSDALWRLKELDDIDKHRLLLAVGTRYTARRATPSERERLRKGFVGSHPGQPVPTFVGMLLAVKNVRMLKRGDELFTIPESEVEPYMQFSFNIAFNESGICEGEPMIETLHQMVKLVRRIVAECESFLS